MVSPFLPDPDKVAAIRELMPATGAGIYLNAGTAGPMPSEVQRAMDEQSARELAIGRGHPDQFPETLERMAEARASVAAALIGDPDDFALTHSTTDGLHLALATLPWAPGDRLVTTNHEHVGLLGSVAALEARLGVQRVTADIGNGDPEATLAAIRDALRDGGARAVAISHVLWTTGAVLPMREIATLAKEAGAVVIVDGAQAAGAIPFAVDELGVDAYAFPAHKWLLGPEGMGALWVDRRFADGHVPDAAGGYSFASVDAGAFVLHGGARRFEGTTFHRPSVIGFARACGWLTMYLGLPWTQARAGELTGAAADRLAAIDGVTLLTPRRAMGTIVTFRIAGWSAEAAAAELGARVFAILRPLPMDALRISVGFWNTPEEIERFARAVELLAVHTPDTLPPRRTLAMLDDA